MSEKKCRILVLQLAHPAAIPQTLLALRAVKQHYPKIEFTLITHESSRELVQAAPWITSHYSLPQALLARVLQSNQEGLQSLVPALATWMEPLFEESWDFLVNWSFHDSSSYLTALLPAKMKIGYSRYRDGTIRLSDGWSQYVYGVIQQGISQEIHWIDLITTQLLTALQIHMGEDLKSLQTLETVPQFKRTIPLFTTPEWQKPGTRWLLIADDDFVLNQMKDDTWFEWCESFLENSTHLRILVLTSSKEILKKADLSHKKIHFMENPISLAQKLNLLQSSQWVMTADQEIGDLAAALQTKVLFLSSNLQNAPYGNGNMAIGALTQSDWIEFMAFVSTDWVHRGQKKFAFPVYRSRIRSPNEGGGLIYEPLFEVTMNEELFESMFVGYLARHWYCGWTPEVGADNHLYHVNVTWTQTLRIQKESVEVIRPILVSLEHKHVQLASILKPMKSAKVMSLRQKERIQVCLQEIQELEKLLERASSVHRCFKIYRTLYRIWGNEQSSDSPLVLCEINLERIRLLREALKIHQDWIDTFLRQTKPVLVPPQAKVIQLRAER